MRVTAVENSPELSKIAKKEDVIGIVMPAIHDCADDRKSWRLRFMVAETTHKLLPLIGNMIPQYNLC